MKKFKMALILTASLMLITSCSNPAGGNDNSGSGSNNGSGNGSGSGSGNGSGSSSGGAEETYKAPELPESKGENPFTGKEFESLYGDVESIIFGETEYILTRKTYDKNGKLFQKKTKYAYSYDSEQNEFAYLRTAHDDDNGKGFVTTEDSYNQTMAAFKNEASLKQYYEESTETKMNDEQWKTFIIMLKEHYELSESASFSEIAEALKEAYLKSADSTLKIHYYNYELNEETLSLETFTKAGLTLKDYFKDYDIPSFYTNNNGFSVELKNKTLRISYPYENNNNKYEYYTITEVTDEKIKLEVDSNHSQNDADPARTEISYRENFDSENKEDWAVTITIDEQEYVLPISIYPSRYTLVQE